MFPIMLRSAGDPTPTTCPGLIRQRHTVGASARQEVVNKAAEEELHVNWAVTQSVYGHLHIVYQRCVINY